MKKIILTAAAVFAFSFANAQDLKSKKGEPYLPEAGDWAISFNADNLFKYVGNAFSGDNNTNEIGSVKNSNSNGSFTGKKFKTANQADRYTVGFQLATSSETLEAGNIYALSAGDEVSFTKFNLNVGIGKEWRRGKTRLQGFYGYDLLAGLDIVNSGKATFKDGDPSQSFKNGVGFNVGAQGFLGAEYFIFPKIAIGASYTYGVNIKIKGSGSDETVDLPIPANSPPGTQPITLGGNGKSAGIDLGNVGVAAISLSLHF